LLIIITFQNQAGLLALQNPQNVSDDLIFVYLHHSCSLNYVYELEADYKSKADPKFAKAFEDMHQTENELQWWRSMLYLRLVHCAVYI